MWRGIETLISLGKLRTSEYVLEELEGAYREAYQRLQPLRDSLVVQINPHIGQWAGQISEQFTSMSHPTGRSNRADPWIIAIAKVEGAMVVTEESRTKEPEKKIPYACEKLDVKAITLRELFNEEREHFIEHA
jgi:hypothetical protein